jgi:hypothetical protein
MAVVIWHHSWVMELTSYLLTMILADKLVALNYETVVIRSHRVAKNY